MLDYFRDIEGGKSLFVYRACKYLFDTSNNLGNDLSFILIGIVQNNMDIQEELLDKWNGGVDNVILRIIRHKMLINKYITFFSRAVQNDKS